jgi:asparagine synthase (glutamine-hydrolysing)
MCGICGVVGIESTEVSEPIVRRMLASIIHRGPDEDGMLVSECAAVGVRRLSIIDLPGGRQPIWNEDGTLAVVFNGEIYNFRQLRRELEALGHRFRTRADTEVVIHGYEAWGSECVQRLEGMFAFAVVELPGGPGGRAKRIFLARDRMGIKPLYYGLRAGKFYFASEVQALVASGCIPPQISAEAVESYLLFGSVSEPATIIEGIVSLSPGHDLAIDAQDPARTVEPKCYWEITNRAPRSGGGGGAPTERVRALLEHAVDSHVGADVPVGVFLSSGIDSTTVAALASRAQPGIHTFTVAFPEAEFNEAEIARRTASALGTTHCEISVSDAEMVSRLDEAISAFDQPSADGVNTYFVSWAARQAGLKVALSGLGSDELFGGYTSFRATHPVARIRKLAWLFPRSARSFLAAWTEASVRPALTPDAKRKVLAAWRDPEMLPHPYFFTRALFTPQVVASAVRLDGAAAVSTTWMKWLSNAAEQARSMDGFTAVSWLELRSYLLNTLLRDTDVMSMSHSLEVRVPFLDSSLVEYVLSLPKSAKADAHRPKSLLIDAIGDLLPKEVVAQRKRTFTFPWDVWLRGKMGERVETSLAEWSPELARHLGPQFAAGVWRDFHNGRTTWSRPWSLYVLNEWAKRTAHPHTVERQPAATVAP